MKNKNWFAVKTIYLSKTVGSVKKQDKHYSPSAVFYEERIVLFQTKDGLEAITKAEKEARQYASSTYRNAYGQTVTTKYLEACDAFEVHGGLESGAEVFSSSEVFENSPGETALVTQKLGKPRTRKLDALRKKFQNAEISDL